ncbi:MAG TPA: hypothetical protein VMU82_15915 [Acetobacteraceae bacterium]|nr:hypothetical protein [Acetobacteraceae bacterium]
MTVLPLTRAHVFFDGTFTIPRLQHPEGVAIGPDGGSALYVCETFARRISRIPIGANGAAEIHIEDPTAHLFAHPANIAFAGHDLFTANLGRWHITRRISPNGPN